MKDHKWNFKRFTAIALAAALVFEGAVPAYAFPGKTEDLSLAGNEAEAALSAESSVSDIDADFAEPVGSVKEETEDVVSVDIEAEGDAGDLSADEDILDAGAISVNMLMPEEPEIIGSELDEVMTVEQGTGYIAPEWEKDLPVIDPSLTPAEAMRMLEENKAGASEGEPAEGYMPILNNTMPSSYPAAYNKEADLRNALEALPDTRNQLNYGTCWAHSAMALAELYKESYEADPIADYDEVDYSERHLSYFTYHTGTNPLSDQSGDTYRYEDASGNLVDETKTLALGGNLDDAAATLARWRGAADEEKAPYPASRYSALTTVDWGKVESDDEVHLTDVYYLNISDDTGRNHAKNWVKEHGGVGISFHTNGSGLSNDSSYFYNSTHNSFYNYSNPEEVNHAVTIVGWDDDFPKEFFSDGETNLPSNNGAWLVRNSWMRPGEYSYKDLFDYYSYFWMSYYDTSLSPTAYAYVVRDASEDEFRHNYYYDSQTSKSVSFGKVSWGGGITTPSYSANVFTIQGNKPQKIKEVSFEVVSNDDYTANSATIKIYRLNSNTSMPDDGTKIAELSAALPYPGRYTVPLSSPVSIDAGESFSIIISLATGRTVCIEDGWVIEYEDSTTHQYTGKREMKTGLNAGESFWGSNYQPNDPTLVWEDLIESSSTGSGNFRISAITEDTDSTGLDPQVKFDLTSDTRTYGAAPFTYTATKKGNGALTYSSSNTSVATVNET
ncbi:MAG: hypothetical protein K6F34_07220, partial [Lachnospiraceae bacterium]|nr:hypothetical protein [Lachnospiraceae bacterium]